MTDAAIGFDVRTRRIMLTVIGCLIGIVSCDPAPTAGAVDTCAALARTPVLFVHGSGMDSATFDRMIRHFEANDYPRSHLYAVDLEPATGDNLGAAEAIANAVRSLLDDARAAALAGGCEPTDPAKVDLIAHSMGAFSSRWFAVFGQPERVRRLVAIAGANHGTDALCGRPGKGNRQMCPAFSARKGPDDIQHRLNGTADSPVDETPYGSGPDARKRTRIPPTEDRRIEYFTVSIADDSWIVPPESALLDGAGSTGFDVDLDGTRFERLSPGNFRYRGSTGHDDLPSDPAVISFVLDLLALPDPRLSEGTFGRSGRHRDARIHCKTRTSEPGCMTHTPVRGTMRCHCGSPPQLPRLPISS